MIRMRKYVNERGKSSAIAIGLVAAIALLVIGISPLLAAYPDPTASDAIDLGNLIEMYAVDMGPDQYPGDLNLWNPVLELSGALWDYFPSDQASGTGVFNTYLAVQAPGSSVHERGFNTGLYGVPKESCNNYDESDSKTSALPLSAVPIVDIEGTLYREFACDINEVSGIPEAYISLEVIQIWQSDSHDLCGLFDMDGTLPDYYFTDPEPELVYDLDWDANYTLILDYGVNTGSGKPDYKVFIPNDWFDPTLDYVVMVVDHGNLELTYPETYEDYGGSDGFEEWGVRIVECTDLSIDKTAPAGPLCPGAEIVYTITVTNNGPEAAESANIIDTLPAGVTVTGVEVDGTPTADYSLVAGVLTYPATGGFALNAAASLTLEITVTAPTDACDDTLVNTATVNAISPVDCDLTNNIDSASTDVGDTTAPELGNLPAGGDLGCNPTPPVCDTNVTASDDCGGDISEDVVCTPGEIEEDGCYRSQTFNYYVEDGCGNNDTADVTYTWKVDLTAPELTGVPDDENLGCNPIVPICDDFNVTASDLCDGALDVVCTPGDVVDLGECWWSQTFTFFAEDLCGNNVSDEVTYTWKEDVTPPEITCPEDFYATGDECSLDPDDTGWPMASDNCDELLDIDYEDELVYGDGISCPWKVIRTWTATDECGNNATCEQEIVCCCEDTIWAYGGSAATEVDDLVRSAEWGWTNRITPGTYEWDLYAGAGQNDLSKGTIVGTLTVTYSGGCVTVTYNMYDANILTEAHLWVGTTKLPLKKGVLVASPGLFPYRPEIAPDGLSATWSSCGFSGTLWVAAHGVTLWCEPQV